MCMRPVTRMMMRIDAEMGVEIVDDVGERTERRPRERDEGQPCDQIAGTARVPPDAEHSKRRYDRVGQARPSSLSRLPHFKACQKPPWASPPLRRPALSFPGSLR